MIDIGIVDDEQIAADSMYKIVKKYLRKKEVDNRIHIYLSGREMLREAEKLALVFLDIEMPDMDGIQTGEKLNEINPDCTIIMATINRERYKEGFRINAFRYITKPFEEEEIMEALESYIKKRTGVHTIEVFCERIPCKIYERDIYYIRAYNGYTMIYTEKRVYRSELSLGEYEEELDSRIFFRIHRSYLVNLLKVDKARGSTIYIGEEELKVSRGNIKEFKIRLIKTDAEYGLGIKIC